MLLKGMNTYWLLYKNKKIIDIIIGKGTDHRINIHVAQGFFT